MKKEIFGSILVFIAIVAVNLGFVWYESNRMKPTGAELTLAGFKQSRPQLTNWVSVPVGEVRYDVCIGPTMAFPALPSGPSCYVFDDQGRLFDWSPNVGEGHAVDQFHNLARSQLARVQ